MFWLFSETYVKCFLALFWFFTKAKIFKVQEKDPKAESFPWKFHLPAKISLLWSMLFVCKFAQVSVELFVTFCDELYLQEVCNIYLYFCVGKTLIIDHKMLRVDTFYCNVRKFSFPDQTEKSRRIFLWLSGISGSEVNALCDLWVSCLICIS